MRKNALIEFFVFSSRAKKREMQKKLDNIHLSDRSLLEKANEIRILYYENPQVFEILNTDRVIESPLGEYMLSNQWDKDLEELNGSYKI